MAVQVIIETNLMDVFYPCGSGRKPRAEQEKTA
jgi:hypothetical protein